MSTFASFAFPRVTSLLHVSIFALTIVIAASQNAPSSSPAASTNLICHTEILADCYPVVFSPTKDFQIVRDDQSIPPGLHVRMNLATGVKEARLNIPEPGDNNEAAIVVIDEQGGPLDSPEPVVQVPHSGDQIIMKDNEKDGDQNVPVDYEEDLLVIRPKHDDISVIVARVSSALEGQAWHNLPEDFETLVDLAYDIELGATMMADSRFTKALLHYIEHGDDPSNGNIVRQAVDLIGVALHNNPAALQSLMGNEGHKDPSPVGVTLHRLNRINPDVECKSIDNGLFFANRLVFLLAQLSQEEHEFDNFLAQDGLALIDQWLRVEPADSCHWAKARLKKRIANFVVDLAPAMSRTLSQGMGNVSALRKVCQGFQIDPNVRYDTSKDEYKSAIAATEALSEVLGESCAAGG